MLIKTQLFKNMQDRLNEEDVKRQKIKTKI